MVQGEKYREEKACDKIHDGGGGGGGAETLGATMANTISRR